MNYTLHQLRIFLKISQTQSITKAAEELNLTQPAVSIQLKNLQDQFDIPLTEVVGRKLYLTDFGKEIAIAAENILNEVYAINYKTLAHKGQLSGRLKISVVSTGKYVMPYFLADFLQLHQGIELALDVTNKARVVESLDKNEVDFSLVSLVPDHMQVKSVDLMKNKLYLVGKAGAAFGDKINDIHIFETLPLIYREEGSATRLVMENFFLRHGISVRRKIELTSNEAVKQAVIAGLGYSVMPLIGLKNELSNGDLAIIPVHSFPIISSWQLIWMQHKNHSPAAASFLQYIHQEKEKIIKARFDWYEKY